jgi:hypothetical protein
LKLRHNLVEIRTSRFVRPIHRPTQQAILPAWMTHPTRAQGSPRAATSAKEQIMNTSFKALLLAAAGSGLISGTAAPVPAVSFPQSGTGSHSQERQGSLPQGFAAQATTPDKHSCKGKNSCKGQGGCKTSDMGCKGKNSCKGKGGCATDM